MKDSSFFDIDRDRLDEEWMRQPKLVWEHSQELADKTRELGEAKAALKVAEAETDNAIRERPMKYGLEKITETAIKSLILTDERCQKAAQEVLHLEHACDILRAVLATLADRRRALESLVELHAINWYAEPRANHATKETVNDLKHKAAMRRVGARKDD